MSGCIPYSVGTTALPAPPDELAPYSTVTFVPAGASAQTDYETEDRETAGYAILNVGARFGIDNSSELYLQSPGLLGFIFGYKRRIAGQPNGTTPALAVSGGAGIVNFGYHAYLEASLLASGPERDRTLAPYGGLRVMHVLPLNENAVSDLPTLGAFVGVRLGSTRLGISPEIGVFYDSPALELREHDIIVVPGITLHGRGLLDIFFR